MTAAAPMLLVDLSSVTVKPLDEFYPWKNGSSLHKRSTYCKICWNAYHKIRRSM